MELQIRHTDATPDGQPFFEVVHNGKATLEPVTLTPPGEVPVGAYQTNLQQDLRWYLEQYLEMPIDEYRTRAEAVQEALFKRGRDCFDALFGSGHGRDWYRDSWREGLDRLRLQVTTDDPAVLCWPWEALASKDDGLLAQQCSIERQLNNIGDVRQGPDTLPQEQINILYIIARPGGDRDVDFQTLARPLIDFVTAGGWPVQIDLLRPPTFDQLRNVLEAKPGFYHIVHFDGHGSFGAEPTLSGLSVGLHSGRDKFATATGSLLFEKDDFSYNDDPISADMLGELLRKYNIPVMVLNVCQSAMLDGQAEHPFGTVAASLLRAGIGSVVAMSYSLWVSGAKVFVPAFYKQLFNSRDLSVAVQAERREMYRQQKRDTFIGPVDFQDWLVPVLYRQGESQLPRLRPSARRESKLPNKAQHLGDYGFIGRTKLHNTWSGPCALSLLAFSSTAWPEKAKPP
ncbi:MAG: CHAT domain-containing protein [Firmicutes bacterium]|nr:CHAT domain-containing protein [Bacillota bacterium]